MSFSRSDYPPRPVASAPWDFQRLRACGDLFFLWFGLVPYHVFVATSYHFATDRSNGRRFSNFNIPEDCTGCCHGTVSAIARRSLSGKKLR